MINQNYFYGFENKRLLWIFKKKSMEYFVNFKLCRLVSKNIKSDKNLMRQYVSLSKQIPINFNLNNILFKNLFDIKVNI